MRPRAQYRQSGPCAGLSTTVHANLTRRGGFFGRRLGEYFGAEATELLEMNWRGKPALVVTRLTCSRPDRLGGSQISPEPAFSIFHQLADAEYPPIGLGERPLFHCPPEAGGVRVMDLRQNTKCELTGPVDLLQYYVPCEALVDLAREYTNSPVQTLSLECERRDPFLSMLSALLLKAVVREERTDWRLFVEQFTFSVLAYFAERYGGLRARDSIVKSGLAPWQERRSKEMMRASLGGDLSIAAIAAECRLTPSHFGRYFKHSTGVTPHQYLTRLRLEEAKRLMLTTQRSLAEIALACGFGDQSYFTRIFSRNVGTSPAAWRRSRSQG
jgi:AraC family transcriptional regulator